MLEILYTSVHGIVVYLTGVSGRMIVVVVLEIFLPPFSQDLKPGSEIWIQHGCLFVFLLLFCLRECGAIFQPGHPRKLSCREA